MLGNPGSRMNIFCRAAFVLICILFTLRGNIARAVEFPYTSYITGDQAHTYSGPGTTGEYRTDHLDRGQRVTIYKQEQGWCAIRPPRGSYSWVEGRFVELVKDGVGKVRQDRAPSDIGSHVQNKRDRMQVELKVGEVIEILESVETANGLWYKIAPPSGEFRWVASTDLSRDPPGQWPAPGGQADPATTTPTSLPKPIEAANPGSEKPLSQGVDDWQSANSNKWREDAARNQVSTPPVAAGGQSLVSTPQNPTAPIGATGVNVNPEKAFQTEYEKLEADISTMMIEDPASWSFGTLNKRSDELMNRSESALQRGQIRMLQNKISRLEELKQRTLDTKALAQSKGISIPNGTAAATPSTTTANPIAKLMQADVAQGRFDGIGKLMPVLARRPNAPKYALVDTNNNIVSLVTPTPGVNLDAYVGQQVGISGERGYIPELKKSHITATSVAPADPASLARRASTPNVAR